MAYGQNVPSCDPFLANIHRSSQTEVLSCVVNVKLTSGVARAFTGGRLAHPENQNEEENR